MVTTERQDRLAREREEIEARVAKFKATQEKFQREREEFFRRTWRDIDQVEPQSFWSSPGGGFATLPRERTAESSTKKPGAELRAFVSLTNGGAYQ